MMNPFAPAPMNFGQLGPQLTMPTPKPKGGMFGSGSDIGTAIAAALNGYLAAGGNPAGIAGLQQLHQQRMLQQRQAQEDAQYQQHRADDNADWMSHYNYELNNPKPKAPGEFEEALIQSGIQPGTPEWAKAMQTRRDNILDPVVMTAQGPMLRSQLVGGGQPAPEGVTFTPVDDGGPTQSGSGGFLY